MTLTEYRKHNGDWFRGKKATVNKQVRNNGGYIIDAGEIVVISGKSGRGGFNIRSEKGISISQVNWQSIDLQS